MKINLLNKGRTMATQSDAAKQAFKEKMFEATAQRVRMSFLTGKVVDLHSICESLGLGGIELNNRALKSKDELTELTLLARQKLKHKADAPEVIKIQVVEPATPEVVDVSPVEAESIVDDDELPIPELTDNPKVQAFGFQVRKTREIVMKLTQEKRKAILLLSQTGSGKTFMLGAAVAAMKRMGVFKDYKGAWPVMYVTKASIVEQTSRVLEECFKLTPKDVYVTNVDQLRSKMGNIFITSEGVIVQGQEHTIFKWRPRSLPQLIIWDESQVLKNVDSTQSRIAQALGDINEFTHGVGATKLMQIFSSATPFMRVCEAKVFAVATRLPL